MEIVLDRKLAEKRTFPSIDINRSGTRKEELLLPPEDLQRIWLLRKVLLPMGIHDTMDLLLQKMKETETNSEFLSTMNS
jgi:transcription termination factor Rho